MGRDATGRLRRREVRLGRVEFVADSPKLRIVLLPPPGWSRCRGPSIRSRAPRPDLRLPQGPTHANEFAARVTVCTNTTDRHCRSPRCAIRHDAAPFRSHSGDARRCELVVGAKGFRASFNQERPECSAVRGRLSCKGPVLNRTALNVGHGNCNLPAVIREPIKRRTARLIADPAPRIGVQPRNA